MPNWFGRSNDTPAGDLNLVVGLGNPGSRFEGTRHNVGFMVIDEIARLHSLRLAKSRHRALTGRGSIAGMPVLLAKPETFMNESGYAVSHLVRYFRVPLVRLIVVCDDMDLPFGTIRLRPDGSSGGQKGLDSIIRELGSNQFPRLRVGVGRPRHSAVSHVLSRFEPDEVEKLPSVIAVCSEAVLTALTDGLDAAMNRYNGNVVVEQGHSSPGH
ncbi:MAG TPA: aminoacyl-tRNA hydrolase [Chloroflexota bacterium]